MTEQSGTRRHSSPRLAGHVLRRQRMEALGVKQEKSTGIFPTRQMEKKIEKEFGKLTVKDQAVLLMSRRKLLGWLAVVSTGAGGLGRRFGPGVWARLGQAVTRFRIDRLARHIDKLEKRTGAISEDLKTHRHFIYEAERAMSNLNAYGRARLPEHYRAMTKLVREKIKIDNLRNDLLDKLYKLGGDW